MFPEAPLVARRLPVPLTALVRLRLRLGRAAAPPLKRFADIHARSPTNTNAAPRSFRLIADKNWNHLSGLTRREE
jgi:hypothetical protein